MAKLPFKGTVKKIFDFPVFIIVPIWVCKILKKILKIFDFFLWKRWQRYPQGVHVPEGHTTPPPPMHTRTWDLTPNSPLTLLVRSFIRFLVRSFIYYYLPKGNLVWGWDGWSERFVFSFWTSHLTILFPHLPTTSWKQDSIVSSYVRGSSSFSYVLSEKQEASLIFVY